GVHHRCRREDRRACAARARPAQPRQSYAGCAEPGGIALMSATPLRVAAAGYGVDRVRRAFPILSRPVHGKPLTYLDSAASSQRPLAVIRAVEDYETRSHANVHRGVHALSQEATAAYEGARERVRRFINARSTREIIFTRGTTEGINLVAQSYGRARLGPGDEILITALEHH